MNEWNRLQLKNDPRQKLIH